MAASAASSTQDKDPDSGLESTASVSSLSSSVNEQVQDLALKRKREVFFEEYADGSLKFSNGKIMKVSTPFLAAESPVFRQLFQNVGKKKRRTTSGGSASSSHVEITDFDFITFELFIECFMGFQECTVHQAIIIFPIAWKYETANLIAKLREILQPKKLNQDLCLSLNMALKCGCDDLSRDIVDFLTEGRLLFRLFSNEEFYFLLEPSSVARLLENVELDSSILLNLFKWAENIMIKKDEPIEFRPFFTKHKIADELSIDCFETTKAFFKFNKSELGRDFFTPQEFQEHVELNGYINRDSSWFEVKAGDKLTEKFIIKKVVLLRNYTTKLDLYRSNVVFYDYPNEDDEDATLQMIMYYISVKQVGAKFPLKRVTSHDAPTHVKAQTCTTVKIDLAANVVCDVEVEVTATFNYDGRILKKSPEQFEHLKSPEEKQSLFFMDYAEFSYKERLHVKEESSKVNPKENDKSESEFELSDDDNEDPDDSSNSVPQADVKSSPK